MKWLTADLHVHTVLSPCAAIEMTPQNLIRHAAHYGIDVVAITDHNASDNVFHTIQAAKDTGVAVLCGMEVESCEEVHLVVLFDGLQQLQSWQKVIDAFLPDRDNDEQRFGAQFVVNHQDCLVQVKKQMLLQPLQLSVDEIASRVKELGGVIVASHIDRPAYSIISQLGFIPKNVQLDAIEISRLHSPVTWLSKYPDLRRHPIVTSSDAHSLSEYIEGPKMHFFINEPTLHEIILALQGKDGRRAVCSHYLE